MGKPKNKIGRKLVVAQETTDLDTFNANETEKQKLS